MRIPFKQAAFAVVPVLSATAAIATLFAAELPFPAAIALSAWPHWVVLAALVFTYSSVGYWLLARLSRLEPVSTEHA
jgi:hypothetical protein